MDRFSLAQARMITHVVAPEQWNAETVEIVGDAYRHLFRARRLAKGEQIRLVDGEGRARWARIEDIDRRSARLLPGELAPAHEPDLRVELFIGAPKPERASWLVEKATEIGVRAVRFISCERSPRSYGESASARLRRMAVAAVEQCHRARVPEIDGVHDWKDLPRLVADLPTRRFLHTDGAERVAMTPSAEPTALMIGPEGGWSETERHDLLALGAVPISLGERILRVETAAVVAASRILLFPSP